MRSAKSPSRSPRGRTFAVALALPAAGLLAGCATTMQEAARLQLNSARIRASQVGTKVTRTNPQVRVVRLAVIASGGHAAYVVTVRNTAGRAVSDLPISVGYRPATGSPTYVNAGDDLSYFNAHLPVIAARGSVTWVYDSGAAPPAGARAFALVGTHPAANANLTMPLPRIAVAARVRGNALAVTLHNVSSVPQYQLQVYAVATRGGADVAAAAATVEHLGTASTRTIELLPLGSLSRATLQVQAIPTIFQ